MTRQGTDMIRKMFRLFHSGTGLLDYLGLIGVILVELVVFRYLSDTFWDERTFKSIMEEVPDTVVAAAGMTFVLIIAGIDLSVGSVLALSQAVLGCCLVHWGCPLPAAIVLCLCTGLLCGALNGLIIIRWTLPSFIVTLGMLEIGRGITYWITESRTLYIGKPVEGIAGPPAFVIAVAVVVLGQLILTKTVFGRYMVAVGSNESVVRICGINPKRVKWMVFTICGMLAALAGIIQASRMASASPNAGRGFELDVIAAVVIGGTSLMGGRGSVVKSFLGVLIVAVLNAGLDQVGVPEDTKRLIKGTAIIAAVILDHYRQKLMQSKG